jgi:hypothetical protein
MPVDFSEDDVPKRKLENCQAHNLKFDPTVTWGCVLCKKAQAKRISWTLIVGGILILFAAGFLIIPNYLNRDDRPTHGTIHVTRPVFDTASDPKDDDDASRCVMTLSAEIEECLARLGDDPANQIDRELCLNPLADLETRCPGAWSADLCRAGPLYNVGALPEWRNILRLLEANQKIFEECLNSRQYRFGLRATIEATTGIVAGLAASAFGLDARARICVYEKLSTISFPASAATDTYSFTLFIDAEVLGQNRPVDENPEQNAYEEFAREKRIEAERAERREQVLQKAQERKERFNREGATDKEE